MSGEPLRVTPTDPPSMAVMVDGHWLVDLKPADAQHDRMDVILMRMTHAEFGLLEVGPTRTYRVGFRVSSVHPSPSSVYDVNVDGWKTVAEVAVSAGQTCVVHGHIASPGWRPREHPAAAEVPPEPKVHLVVYDTGQICTALVDNPELAEKRAEAVNGVVVELPILKDYREKGD